MDLEKNELWRKKIFTALKARDVNKDGFISNADFDMIIQRYKDMGISESHSKKLHSHYNELCKILGIADGVTKLTYEQVRANFAKAGAKSNFTELAKIASAHFELIDTDENGEISFKEWVDFYKAMGIDTVHARPSFDAMDTNHHGVISGEEFAAYFTEFFFTTEDKLKSSIMFGPLLDNC